MPSLYKRFNLDPNSESMIRARRIVAARYKCLDQLVEARVNSGLSAAEVEEQMGVPSGWVTRFESGEANPTWYHLQLYAHVVGVVLSYALS